MLFESPYQHAASHAEKGIHFDFIKRALPGWLSSTTLARVRAVQAASPCVYTRITSIDRTLNTASKEAMAEHWTARNTVDETFKYVKDIYTFAEPLLKNALREYGNIDVKNTFIRLYAPAKNSWWAIGIRKGVTSRTVSLLDAALHNFFCRRAICRLCVLVQGGRSGPAKHSPAHLAHQRPGLDRVGLQKPVPQPEYWPAIPDAIIESFGVQQSGAGR
ncbi:DUF6543 domain-containing protein [Pseudomonas sp. 28 E 9]|uniref:DUF6543 domain-containing protein n=1 Tax=Pseudomonas sp. 28 E 9 TaxID=1844098 RepID=UPI002114041F|nr:DUF6543 domain-containing protein [Pseudomonas sp. 28 E 9]